MGFKKGAEWGWVLKRGQSGVLKRGRVGFKKGAEIGF